MKIAQIAISEFGQVPEQIFDRPHPPRNWRKDMNIDLGMLIYKGENVIGFQYNEAGIMIWSDKKITFKKVAINGLYNSF